MVTVKRRLKPVEVFIVVFIKDGETEAGIPTYRIEEHEGEVKTEVYQNLEEKYVVELAQIYFKCGWVISAPLELKF